MNIKYELRDVEAWACDDGWTWNNSFHLADYYAEDQDPCTTFIEALEEYGIFPNWDHVYIADDMDVLELRDKETDEPYFAAIPWF